MISHHHETLFVHIPKCGGMSIELMFLTDLGLDWDTRAPLLLRQNPTRSLGPQSLAHLLPAEYLRYRYLSEKLFAAYYRFAFVRDPYARAVSLYNYLFRRPEVPVDTRLTLAAFVQDWLPGEFRVGRESYVSPHDYPGQFWFVRPQVDFIHDDAGRSLVDDVFRLEERDAALPRIRARSGVRAPQQHANRASGDIATVADLTSSHRAIIGDLYRRDFEALGYAMA